jgi:hypothetical protein
MKRRRFTPEDIDTLARVVLAATSAERERHTWRERRRWCRRVAIASYSQSYRGSVQAVRDLGRLVEMVDEALAQ